MADAAMAELQAVTKSNSDAIAGLTKTINGVVDKLAKTPAAGSPSPDQVFGKDFRIRTGEDPLSSRGYSFMKMLGVLTGAVDLKDAKVELDVHSRMHQCFAGDTDAPYEYGGRHRPGEKAFLAPMATSFLNERTIPRAFRQEMKALTRAGLDGCDPEEARWIRNKMWGEKGYNVKTLSWLNDQLGGALVAPAEQGELIELLRNKEALVNAGARVVPLPPQGRMKFPRQTSASLTYWVGENSPISESNIGTGEITLQAKKLAVLIKAPNELLRFASPAAEALMRDDMTKSLALGLDLAGLEGLGGDNRPLGIINRAGINIVNSSIQGANGDKIVGQDAYRMIAAIEESNAEFEGWIMRPKTMYKYFQLRWDAVAQGDAAGGFLFNLIRGLEDSEAVKLAGYPVVKSTQVSQVQSKGTASNLTYILGGMFSDVLIGMFGAIEFAATTQGDTAFVNDQTWVRGILSADIQLRHEVSMVLMNNLDTTL